MKRTPLRRHSKNPRKRLLVKADKALQDWYRANYKEKCESCGAPFELMHHHLPKSQSSYGRYERKENLIFMCKKCHNALHFGCYDVVSAYTLKRGPKWKKRIDKIARIHITLPPKKLEEIIEKYKTAK